MSLPPWEPKAAPMSCAITPLSTCASARLPSIASYWPQNLDFVRFAEDGPAVILTRKAVSASASGPKVDITLPDGKVLSFARGVTGAEVAAAIGPGLAKAALIVEVNGKPWDLFRPIEENAKLRVITRKDPEALELIRHDAAHVLAMAVQELLPGTQVTIGPAIEDGFYYDFARKEPFTPDDLPKIEPKMRETGTRDLSTQRLGWPPDGACCQFER